MLYFLLLDINYSYYHLTQIKASRFLKINNFTVKTKFVIKTTFAFKIAGMPEKVKESKISDYVKMKSGKKRKLSEKQKYLKKAK